MSIAFSRHAVHPLPGDWGEPLRGALPIEFSLKKTLPKNPQVEAEIATLYAFLLHVRFGVSNAKPLVEQAIRDAYTALGWLNDRTSLKKSLVERWEKKHGGKHRISCHIRGVGEGDDFDYANTLLGTWRWPRAGQRRLLRGAGGRRRHGRDL